MGVLWKIAVELCTIKISYLGCFMKRVRRKERPLIENVGTLEDFWVAFYLYFSVLLFEGDQEGLSQIQFITWLLLAKHLAKGIVYLFSFTLTAAVKELTSFMPVLQLKALRLSRLVQRWICVCMYVC